MKPIPREYSESCEKNYYEKNYYIKEESCPTMVKCGYPNSVTIPLATIVGATFNLASLTLNTSCYCDPHIKLDFISNFVVPVTFTGTLNIQVFKQCRGDVAPRPIGPVWTYNALALLEASTFSFFVCDFDNCDNGCCTYTVVATNEAITVGTLNMNNCTLSATVTCRNSCHKCRRYEY